jgi:Asp-tRNA(Asn)/Glu-tRNA(Gln) amidotransferase A subunit family amidase
MDIAVCAGWTPFSATELDDLVTTAATALRSAGHEVEEIRIPSGSTDEGRLGAAMAWRMAPVAGDLVLTIGSPACHVRHPRKVVWLIDADAVEQAALTDATAVLATTESVADAIAHRLGLRVGVLLPGDTYLVERLIGALR